LRTRPDLAVPVIVRAIDNPLEAERAQAKPCVEFNTGFRRRRRMQAGKDDPRATLREGRSRTDAVRPMLDEQISPRPRSFFAQWCNSQAGEWPCLSFISRERRYICNTRQMATKFCRDRLNRREWLRVRLLKIFNV